MTVREAKEGVPYLVQSITTGDEELNAFLFSLGCYSGEPITVISQLKNGCIVAVKESRYSIDSVLAESISVREE